MSPRGDGCFPETRWSRVARIRSDDAAVAAKALDELCAQYHYPLYCYLRRRGCAHHDAEDVLHDFLAGLVRLRALERLRENSGRLRGYLSVSLGRHLREWRHRETRRERPASDFHDVPDFEAMENRYQRERLTDTDTPDRLFERKWAVELMRQAMETLAARYAQKGRAALFAALRPVLERGGSLRGGDSFPLGAQLGLSENALRVALNRLLEEFREEVRAGVRLTVEHSDEVPAEMAHLRGLFQR